MHIDSVETMIDVIEDGLKLKLEIQTIKNNFLKLLTDIEDSTDDLRLKSMENWVRTPSINGMDFKDDNLSLARVQIKALYDARKLRSRTRNARVLSKVNALIEEKVASPYLFDENNKENTPTYHKQSFQSRNNSSNILSITEQNDSKPISVKNYKHRSYSKSSKSSEKNSRKTQRSLLNDTSVWSTTHQHLTSENVLTSPVKEKLGPKVNPKDNRSETDTNIDSNFNQTENIRDISQITELSMYCKPYREQASSDNINESVIFHSTFNYPLHSTLNNPFNCTMSSDTDENIVKSDYCNTTCETNEANKTIKANLEEICCEKNTYKSRKCLPISNKSSTSPLNNLSQNVHSHQNHHTNPNRFHMQQNILNKLKRQTGHSNLKTDDIKGHDNLHESNFGEVTHNFTRILDEHNKMCNTENVIYPLRTKENKACIMQNKNYLLNHRKTLDCLHHMSEENVIHQSKKIIKRPYSHRTKSRSLHGHSSCHYTKRSNDENQHHSAHWPDNKCDARSRIPKFANNYELSNQILDQNNHKIPQCDAREFNFKKPSDKIDVYRQISSKKNKSVKRKLKQFIDNFTDESTTNCVSFQTLAQI